NYLATIAVAGPADVWAAGYQVTGAAKYQTLVLRWNGAAWSVVPAPNAGDGDNLIQGIAAAAPDDAWAVGFANAYGTETATLLEHWDGVAWTIVPGPSPGASSNSLNDVAVVAPDDVWAVGSYHDGANNVSLVLRWDGISWSVVPSPNIAASGNILNAIAA